MAESDVVSKETASIKQLREKMRTKMKISRQEHRHVGSDSIRIAIGDTYTENLRNYTEDDVLKLAKAIKQQKHAKPRQLNQLSHAFLQSAGNIQCFLNVTGALNVIVKELTGNNNDAQSLAAECVCNLSLGSEIASEKLALNAASYLITFLKSSNERLLRTSLWTITNLAASGDRTLKILVDQEVIKSLVSVFIAATGEEIKEDALQAIDVAVESSVLRPEDVVFLFESIQNLLPSSLLTTKILYKLLVKSDFQPPDSSRNLLASFLGISVSTVFRLYRNIQSFSIENLEPFAHLIISMRIIGNLLATAEGAANHLIIDGFAANNVEVGPFFKDLLETMDDEASQREILWVARNLLENNYLNCDCLTYLNRGDFGMNQLIEHWRQLSIARI